MTRRNAPASRRSSSRGSIKRLAFACRSGGAKPTVLSRDEEAMFAAQEPRAADPAGYAVGGAPPERQRKANRLIEPLLEDLREAGAFLLVIQLGLERVHVDRQPALLP